MRTTRQAHLKNPWRVQTLAADFELLDVWQFDAPAEPGRGFDEFLEIYWQAIHVVERSALSRMRVAIGRAVGWDEKVFSLPIPGCTETHVAARLSERDRASNRFGPTEPSPLPVAGVQPVYRFDDEALYEVSNDTVHALMHVSCAKGARPELAIYIKSRGVFTRLYMAAIWPARHAVVYPLLTSAVERRWREGARQAA